MREVPVAHVELSLSGAIVPQARTPVGSEFVTFSFWLGCIPMTCGTYWQPFWSRTTSVAGVSKLKSAIFLPSAVVPSLM